VLTSRQMVPKMEIPWETTTDGKRARALDNSFKFVSPIQWHAAAILKMTDVTSISAGFGEWSPVFEVGAWAYVETAKTGKLAGIYVHTDYPDPEEDSPRFALGRQSGTEITTMLPSGNTLKAVTILEMPANCIPDLVCKAGLLLRFRAAAGTRSDSSLARNQGCPGTATRLTLVASGMRTRVRVRPMQDFLRSHDHERRGY
jgi:hypothetical protein